MSSKTIIGFEKKPESNAIKSQRHVNLNNGEEKVAKPWNRSLDTFKRLKSTQTKINDQIIKESQKKCLVSDRSASYSIRAHLGKNICDIETEVDLLKAKDYINGRLTQFISNWEEHNNLKLDSKEDVEMVLDNETSFPTGFGYHLTNELAYTKKQEPELSKLYDVVMILEDKETRDMLLCFLDDFKIKREVLKIINHSRCNLLVEVQRWMQKGLSLGFTDTVSLSYALEWDQRLSETYCKMIADLEKLRKLKIDMDFAMNRRAKKPLKVKTFCSPSPTKATTHCSTNIPACSEIMKVVLHLKTNISEGDYEDFIDHVEDIAKYMNACETDIKNVKIAIVKAKLDYKVITLRQTTSKRKLVDMRLHVKELEEHVKPKSSKVKLLGAELEQHKYETKSAASLMTGKWHPKTTEDASVQTESKMEESVSFKRSPRTHKKHPSLPRTKSPTQITDVSGTTSITTLTDGSVYDTDSGQSNFRFRQTPTRTDRRKLHSRRSRKQSRREPPAQPVYDREIKTEYRSFASPVSEVETKTQTIKAPHFLENTGPNLTNINDTEGANKAKKRGKKRWGKSKRDKKSVDSQGSVDVPLFPEEDPDSVMTMVNTLSEKMQTHVQKLIKTFQNVRYAAKKEIGMRMSRGNETKLLRLPDKMKLIVDFLNLQLKKLPVFCNLQESVEIRGIQRPNHRCRFCACQLSSESVVLDTNKTAEAVGKTLDHCHTFTSMLNKVKQRYSFITQQMTEAKHHLSVGLERIQHIQTKDYSFLTEFSTLEENIDEEIKKLVVALELPKQEEDLQISFERVKELAEAVSNVTTQILSYKRNTDERLLEMQDHDEFLFQLVGYFDKADQILDYMTLDICRLRCRNDALVCGRILKGCHCQFCRCYNTPFHDNLRCISGIKNTLEFRLKSVTQVLSYLTQGQDSLEVELRNPDRTKRVVIGAQPGVLEQMEISKGHQLRALALLCGITHSKLTIPKNP